MKVCPKCGYHDPPYWRVCRWDNPDGELEVCRIDDLQFNNPQLAEKIANNRGMVITDDTFAYLLGKKAVYVKRVAKHFYESVGDSAFCTRWQHTKTRIVRDASGYRRQLPREGVQQKL